MYFWHICSGHDTLFPLQEGAEANIQEETRKRALGRHAVFFLIDIVLMNWFSPLKRAGGTYLYSFLSLVL